MYNSEFLCRMAFLNLVEFVDNGVTPLHLLLFCLCIANLEGLIQVVLDVQERVTLIRSLW